MNKVLILGGYGNFGKRIAVALARHHVAIIIAGRDLVKAEALAAQILIGQPKASVMPVSLDADRDLKKYLQEMRPAVVVNTCGPFQDKDYRIAEICIQEKVHYIDLADGREFVVGIRRLDTAAKEAGVCVVSGASTVPGLSSAVLEHYKYEFSQIDELVLGISPGQKAERGLATTKGILSYVGKKLKPVPGDSLPRYGWQDLYRQKYPGLGHRWMANCDIPDLDLLPQHYGMRRIRFSAGMENPLLHLGIWALSWLVRLGVPLNLSQHALFFLSASHWFDRLGSDAGGMHVIIKGKNLEAQPHERAWFIIAKKGDGPQIPCVPAILLAKRLAEGTLVPSGAKACLGSVGLREYLEELKRFSVTVYEE